jgi:hypothetical protein
MADVRSCPSCDRPNRRGAKRCLYCSAELPPIPTPSVSPELDSGFLPELNTGDLDPLPGLVLSAAEQPLASAPPTFEPPQFASRDEALLDGLSRGGGPFGPREAALRFILLPDSRYAAQLEPMRQAIHEYLDIDLYTATQALQKEIPSYLGSTGHPDVGKFVGGPLRELGIRVLMIERASWLEGTEPERVVKLNLADPQVITFIREDGSSFEVIRGAIRWAAVGEVRPEGLMPSIGEPRNPSDDGRSLGAQEGGYQLLDLLRRDNRRPIRIRSDSFDFSALGPDQGLSANLNLRKLLGQLTRDPANPEVLIPLDENFRKVPHLPGAGLGAAGGPGSINRRELEFTEYVLLLDARHHF